MAYAITLNKEVLNQAGAATKLMTSDSTTPPTCDGEFWNFGDILVRSSLVDAIVQLRLTNQQPSMEILHG